MERLSGLDSAFLSFETPSMHLHVAIAAVIDPSTMATPYSFDELKAFISRRLMGDPIVIEAFAFFFVEMVLFGPFCRIGIRSDSLRKANHGHPEARR